MRATWRQVAATTTLILSAVQAACGGGGGGSDAPTAPGSSTPTPVTPTTPGVNEVLATTSNTFSPGTLTVSKGTTVTFTFQGTTHNVSFANVTGAPASIGNTANAGVQRLFATAGTFGYECTLHSGMTGTVIVN